MTVIKRAILAAAIVGRTMAWWDEGHSVACMIAKLDMSDTDVKKVEDLLEIWEPLYPEVAAFELLAIWNDNVRCYEDTARCNFARYDGLKVFDHWHWTSHPHQPGDAGRIDLNDTVYEFYPLPSQGAGWAGDEMFSALTFNTVEEPRDDHGTILSTNFQLRGLAHFITDLHMPCHTMETFFYPNYEGDVGCNAWDLAYEDPNCETLKDHPRDDPPRNLHALWDSAGLTMEHFWPDLPESHLKPIAERLMNEHTRATLKERLDVADGMNVTEVSMDTTALARDNMVFNEFDFEVAAKTNPVTLPYCPSAAYMTLVKEQSEMLIALAGYRMATIFTEIAKSLPTAEAVKDIKEPEPPARV
eukprot:Polyplicarium_translucidae@DN1408_c0_g1_i1.p1